MKFIEKLFGPKKPLVVLVCGPTASGKTGFSLSLASQLKKIGINSEIISADSRQVYRGIPIFSGAVTDEETHGIRHHMVGEEDVAQALSVSWFKKNALRITDQIISKKSLPMVVGGSSFWIESLMFQDDYPKVLPNPELRRELEGYSNTELLQMLHEIDPRRAGEIDQDNPRRLIRAIEIGTQLGYVPQVNKTPQDRYRFLLIHISPEKTVSDQKIITNVEQRMGQGMVKEAQAIKQKVGIERMKELGLAYKHIELLWNDEISDDEFIARTIREEQLYAKKQRTFLRKIIANYRGAIFSYQTKIQSEDLERIVLWVKKHF